MKKASKIMKQMRRNLITVCGVFACTLLFSISVHAATTGTVVPASATIRSEASTSSTAVGSIAGGKSVSITEEVTGSDGNTWYHIEAEGGTTGYMRSDLVNKSGTAEGNSASATTTQAESGSGVISTDSANIRSTASTSGTVVASLKKGAAVTITGQAEGNDGKTWYQVSFTSNGSTQTGFVRSDLVSDGEASVTEVTGSQGNSAGADDAETPSSEEGEEPTGEDVTEPSTEDTGEAGNGATASGDTGSVNVMNTEETPALPAGFQEVAVTLNGESVRAWKNGDFYIFYGQDTEGNEGYFMYDSVESLYQRYFMTNTEAPSTDGGGMTEIFTPVVIVLAVLIVLLLIAVAILVIKMNDYREELEWALDEYPEDDYPEDEEEDEEDDYLEERPVRRKKRPEPAKKPTPVKEPRREAPKPAPKTPSKPAPKAAPENERERKPVRKSTGAKPRNFMEEESAQPVKKAVKKKPQPVRHVSHEEDPEDEDTFVFINLDGDDID